MKTKALLATLIGAVALNGATAGEWCPPAAKGCETACCPHDCCADKDGSVSFGYDSDYIYKGVRLAGDSVWADANYTFYGLPLPVNLGVFHLSSLGSGAANGGSDNYGDETRLYANVELPSILGFDHGVGYTYFMFPNQRFPQGSGVNGNNGDSFSQVSYTLSREIFCGITASYLLDYRFGDTFNTLNGGNGGTDDSGGFMHTLDIAKSINITDCLAMNLNAGVLYGDNYWNRDAFANRAAGNTEDSGWSSYYVRAAVPVALSGCATLTPYLQYNGTPDTWVADGLVGNGGLSASSNSSDVLSGGVSINVKF